MKNLFDDNEVDTNNSSTGKFLMSLREIQDLTGFGFRRIQKRIGSLKPIAVNGPAHYYDLREVIPLLYKESQKQQDAYVLEQERAKLAAKQTERTDLIIQRMKSGVW